MGAIGLLVAILVLTGCTPAYWGRPGATLPALAEESEACYQAALDLEAPSALPGPGPTRPLLQREEPPPRLWERAPRDAGFARFDEQLRYERCMKNRGWQARRSGSVVR